MVSISLDFSGDPNGCSLERVTFAHPLLYNTEIVSSRGRNFDGAPCFPWSMAVRAFSLLAVLKAARESSNISGIRGSLASSLDYAISKQPQWLCDMFGVDSNGVSLIRRVLGRTNPERKRVGPVSVYFKTDGNLRVEVSLNGISVCEESKFGAMITCLKGNLETASCATELSIQHQKTSSLPHSLPAHQYPILDSAFSSTSLIRWFSSEARAAFNSEPVFNPQALHRRVLELSKRRFVRKLGSCTEIMADLNRTTLRGGEILGIPSDLRSFQHALGTGATITIGASIGVVGALVLLKALPEIALRCKIDLNFYHCSDLVALALSSGEDALDGFVIAFPAALHSAAILRRRGFLPVMLMPAMGHSIARGSNSMPGGSKRCGTFHFTSDNPGTMAMSFEQYVSSHPDAYASEIRHAPPHLITSLLRHGDGAEMTILGFPNNIFNETSGTCSLIEDRLYQPTVLFLSKRNTKNGFSRNIQIALRHLWYTMSIDDAVRVKYVESLLADETFSSLQYRSCGLHSLSRDALGSSELSANLSFANN